MEWFDWFCIGPDPSGVLALNRPPARPVVYPHSTLVPRLDTGLSSGLTQDRCDRVNACQCAATIICSVDCRIAVLTDRRQIVLSIELWIGHRLEDWQRIDIWFVMEGRMDWGMATGLASDSDGLAFD